jgi:hypothetical protein
MSELEAFHRFLGDQITNGGSALSPQECLDLWRAQHPLAEQLTDSVHAVKEALEDMESGDQGQPLRDFLSELRAQKNLPS